MRKNVKKRSFMLVVLLVAYLLVGCNSDTNTANVVSTEKVIEITESSPEKDLESSVIQENDSTGGTECPEGYVYDYQVSMEPIPEEIAALGGPCQGTIHAYPSKIAMALTELEMEKDSVLKAEVEKRIPEVEAALEEEYGGEFVVDGVILSNDFSWSFFCTEISTDYQFEMFYINNEYDAQVNGNNTLSNRIFFDDYFDEKESFAIREDVIPILEQNYVNGDFMVRCQSGANTIDVVIAQYTTEDVDKTKEQIRLLEVWKALQNYNNDMDYNISLTYYPIEYSDMIKEKYSSSNRYDFASVFLNDNIFYWKRNNEIWCSLEYSEFSVMNGDEAENMDRLLQQYIDGTYDSEKIWKYWL